MITVVRCWPCRCGAEKLRAFHERLFGLFPRTNVTKTIKKQFQEENVHRKRCKVVKRKFTGKLFKNAEVFPLEVEWPEFMRQVLQFRRKKNWEVEKLIVNLQNVSNAKECAQCMNDGDCVVCSARQTRQKLRTWHPTRKSQAGRIVGGLEPGGWRGRESLRSAAKSCWKESLSLPPNKHGSRLFYWKKSAQFEFFKNVFSPKKNYNYEKNKQKGTHKMFSDWFSVPRVSKKNQAFEWSCSKLECI